MKKETKKSILFYAASALLYMASLISFISGNDNSMAVVWLCLGSSFLCLGSTHLCLGLSRKRTRRKRIDSYKPGYSVSDGIGRGKEKIGCFVT